MVKPQACGPRPFEENMHGEVRRPRRARSRRVPPVRAPRATAAATPMEVSDDEKQARHGNDGRQCDGLTGGSPARFRVQTGVQERRTS
jgi:hypothetical protein